MPYNKKIWYLKKNCFYFNKLIKEIDNAEYDTNIDLVFTIIKKN